MKIWNLQSLLVCTIILCISDPRLCLKSDVHSLHAVMRPGQCDEEDAGGFTKTFPDIPCVFQMSGGLSWRFSNLPGSRKSGHNASWLGTWDNPLRTDWASLKSFESFIELRPTHRWSQNDLSLVRIFQVYWERSTNSGCIENIQIPSKNERTLMFFGLLTGPHRPAFEAHQRRTPFHPKQTLFFGVTFLRTHPLPATPFQRPRSRTATLG